MSPTPVLLIGSMPLPSTSEAFHTAIRSWQASVFPSTALQTRWGGQPTPPNTTFTLSDLKPTGYDTAAIDSFATFTSLQNSGVLPPNLRFQVILPSPMGVVRGWVATEHCVEIEKFYEQRWFEALSQIQEKIENSKLTVQLDLPFEVAMLEVQAGRLGDENYRAWFPDVKTGILERLVRLTKAVAPEVELGFHLCYGDMGHVHFVEPEDLQEVVSFANEIVRKIGAVHPVSYVHMPVPKGRVDEGYFAPLGKLELGEARLYLGLVHPGDKEGTEKRMALAEKAYPKGFGIASECGLGRTEKGEFESVVEIAGGFATG